MNNANKHIDLSVETYGNVKVLPEIRNAVKMEISVQ